DVRIRPVVAQDGGDIIFDSFKDGVVYLHLRGSCAGCPGATATLKTGVESVLKHFIPEVKEVQVVK
ncbi:MAG: NifU family protein, partial [Alphaproteobacteria bacterium]|nr:NifU family protein [Alphaproteobacteria bacterium]